MLLMAVLVLYMLHGYAKDFETFSALGGRLKEVINEVELSDGKRKISVDPSLRWLPVFSDPGDRTPIRNAMVVVDGILALGAVLTAVLLFTPGHAGRMPLFTYIFEGQWARGLNLFAATSILILLLEVVAVMILLKLIIRIVSTLTGTRGETVCRLLLNLLNYLAVIVFLFFALQYIGFDVVTLLASLGLLTFALSLGAKDLVTDILAGIYKGIESFSFSFGKSMTRIQILAECSEHNYRYVRHELNHALAMLFEENHIQIM